MSNEYDFEIVDNPNKENEKWLVIDTEPTVKGGDFYAVKLLPCNKEMIELFYDKKYSIQ